MSFFKDVFRRGVLLMKIGGRTSRMGIVMVDCLRDRHNKERADIKFWQSIFDQAKNNGIKWPG